MKRIWIVLDHLRRPLFAVDSIEAAKKEVERLHSSDQIEHQHEITIASCALHEHKEPDK